MTEKPSSPSLGPLWAALLALGIMAMSPTVSYAAYEVQVTSAAPSFYWPSSDCTFPTGLVGESFDDAIGQIESSCTSISGVAITFHHDSLTFSPSGCQVAPTLPCNGSVSVQMWQDGVPYASVADINYGYVEYDDEPEPEANCADLSGRQFTIGNPYAGMDGYNDPTIQGMHGWDYGCEWAVTRCDGTGQGQIQGSSCNACYTGDGTKQPDASPARRWGTQTIGSGPDCPISPDPQPHPGYCTPDTPGYDAHTDTCPLGDPDPPEPKDCDDPTYDPETEPCTWMVPDPETGEPVYSPPSPQPPPPYPDVTAPPPPAPTPTPPVNDGNAPGYTGSEGNTPGTIGNNAGGVPGTNVNPGFTGGSGTGSTEDTGSVSWGSLPTIPVDGFYDRDYEGGMSGVVADRMSEMQETPLFGFLDQFQIAQGIGIEPVFSLDLRGIGMGTYSFGLYGGMTTWNILKVVVLITALLVCRRIIFGG